ncbi:MAG: glycosyltransferase family 4 protein [Deltaproteobacteria bacterium]|nr:glycosyltransferase family 4 protein [Deltaproteobacteria bacterium]
MSAPRVAFVMEQTLGNVTHYLNLRSQAADAAGIDPLWLPIEYSEGRLWWALRGSVLAWRTLQKNLGRVDACFMHTTTLALLSGRTLRKRPVFISSDGTALNKRYMREAYGLEPDNALVQRGKRLLYRDSFQRAAGLIAWSRWTKDSFVNDYGCREETVSVLPPGVDLSEGPPPPRTNEKPRILFVGGEFERKGGMLLLDLFRRRLRGRATLVLLTRTPEVQPEEDIEVHRWRAPNASETKRLSAEADAFALPTRADCFPFACLEAMAAALPVVSTRVGAIPEMVEHGQSGYLADIDDADAMGDALEALVLDRALRERMGANGRAAAARNYDLRTTARALFEHIRARC